MQYDKQKKSEFLKQLLGHLEISNSQKELEKVLSMKYTNNGK